MGRKRSSANIVEVAYSNLSLESYAEIYDYILRIKNEAIPICDPSYTVQNTRLLTMKNLSEVLKIHGLSSNRLSKGALLERLARADIFNPQSSSIDLGDFECDLPAEEMERDLAALGWFECPLKSVNAVQSNPAHYQFAVAMPSQQEDQRSKEAAAPKPAFTKAGDAEGSEAVKIQCVSEIFETECSKQIVPSQSGTHTDLLKLMMQMRSPNVENSSEKKSVIRTQNLQ